MVAIAIAIVLRPRAHANVPLHMQVQAPPLQAQAPPPVLPVAARRLPAPPWSASSRADLQNGVRDALAPAVSGARDWSCIVIAQNGSVLYDDRATDAVEPASTEKLIVTDAALAKLGPQFRFDTLLASTQPVRGDTLDGDLWLIGSGDPSLQWRDLRDGAHALRKDGITNVHGRLVVDPSAIAGEEINPLWNPGDSNESFMAATSGISIDEDTVEFDVTGTSDGSPAQVRIVPDSKGVTYFGGVTTDGSDDVVVAATEAPNQFHVYGDVPAGVTERYWVPVHGIPQYVGGVADVLLRQAGIAFVDPPQTGEAPVTSQILWEHRSRPLIDLLHHMLVFSDNHFAEQIMRSLSGPQGAPADDADGIHDEETVLHHQGIPVPGLHLSDGSGLAHANRVSALTLARILARFDAQPDGNAVYPLLARGGRDGTLKWYHFVDASGRVRAKSGHLDDASSLAGYVTTRKHGRVVFAFLINGSPGDPDAAIVSAVDRISEH